MDKPAEIYGEILARVLHPAAVGEALRIGRPFGARRCRLAAEVAPDKEDAPAGDELRKELSSSELDPAESAVVERVRRLVAVDVPVIGPRLTGEVVWLAGLLHDLIASFHPGFQGALRGSSARTLLDGTLEALSNDVPNPATLRGAFLRHAWLGDLPKWSCARVDVRWWTGHASFVGKPPPQRLLAWPEVRRVRVDEKRVPLMRLHELYADRPETSAMAETYGRAMAAFFGKSPITDLALAARSWPLFSWTPAIADLVASAAGARVARRAIAQGEELGRPALEVIAQVAGERAVAILPAAASAEAR